MSKESCYTPGLYVINIDSRAAEIRHIPLPTHSPGIADRVPGVAVRASSHRDTLPDPTLEILRQQTRHCVEATPQVRLRTAGRANPRVRIALLRDRPHRARGQRQRTQRNADAKRGRPAQPARPGTGPRKPAAPAQRRDRHPHPARRGAGGESNIEIDWQQHRPVRLAMSLDDGESRSTGKYLATAALSVDPPLAACLEQQPGSQQQKAHRDHFGAFRVPLNGTLWARSSEPVRNRVRLSRRRNAPKAGSRSEAALSTRKRH